MRPYRVYADISPDYYCAAKAKGALFNRLRLGLACEHQIRRLGVAYIQVWLFQIAINKQLDLLTDVARVASSIWQSEQVRYLKYCSSRVNCFTLSNSGAAAAGCGAQSASTQLWAAAQTDDSVRNGHAVSATINSIPFAVHCFPRGC